MQCHYDRMAWPVTGIDQLDNAQVTSSGQFLCPQSRLFFAGEATHRADAYTVHGAFMSGTTRCPHWLLPPHSLPHLITIFHP